MDSFRDAFVVSRRSRSVPHAWLLENMASRQPHRVSDRGMFSASGATCAIRIELPAEHLPRSNGYFELQTNAECRAVVSSIQGNTLDSASPGYLST
jgi:hypothetical protein